MDCYSLLLCLFAGFQQLRHCTCLQTLDISYIKVDASFLSTLTSLRSLTARSCHDKLLFGDAGNALAGLTNLTALNFASDGNIGERGFVAGTPHLHAQRRHMAPLAK